MRRSISALVVTFVVSASVLAPRPARAQDNAAAVEALFVAGKKLMSEGKIAEACPKFLASYNLEHRLGTLLNLADCYERNEQLASAWARFVEAATLAQRAGQADRAAFAADHAKALDPKLSTLLITAQAAPGLVVTRDGVTVDPGAYGVAVAVDGGTHHVEARAPGKKSWTADVAVKPTVDRATLTVPPLEAAPLAVVASASEPAASGSPTRRTLGIATAGVGLASVVVGAIFGAAAIGKNHDSAPDCGLGGMADACNSTGIGLRSTAVTDGTLSTVFIGVGAAAIVGGGVLWLTARSSGGATTVGFDGRSLELAGTF